MALLNLGFDRFDGTEPLPNGSPEDFAEHRDAYTVNRSEVGKTYHEFVHVPWMGVSRWNDTTACRSTDELIGSKEFWFYPVTPGNEPWQWFSDGFYKWVPERVLDEIRNGRCYFLLNQANEGHYIAPGLYERIHRALDAIGVHPKKFIFLTGNHLVPSQYAQWIAQQGLTKRIQTVAFDVFEEMALLRYQQHADNPEMFVSLDAAKAAVKREKRFMCLMRRPRQVRYAALLHMYKMGILSQGYVSFPAREGWHEHYVDMIDNVIPVTHPRYAGLVKHKEGVDAILPLTVDQPDLRVNHAVGSETAWPYLQSYFSVIPETIYDPALTLFISEKTFKPISNFHPILFLASPGTCALMRQKGYETFHEFWDESYDQIIENNRRFFAVMTVLEWLCSLSDDEAAALYKRSLPVLEHNYRHFRASIQRRPNLVDSLILSVANSQV